VSPDDSDQDTTDDGDENDDNDGLNNGFVAGVLKDTTNLVLAILSIAVVVLLCIVSVIIYKKCVKGRKTKTATDAGKKVTPESQEDISGHAARPSRSNGQRVVSMSSLASASEADQLAQYHDQFNANTAGADSNAEGEEHAEEAKEDVFAAERTPNHPARDDDAVPPPPPPAQAQPAAAAAVAEHRGRATSEYEDSYQEEIIQGKATANVTLQDMVINSPLNEDGYVQEDDDDEEEEDEDGDDDESVVNIVVNANGHHKGATTAMTMEPSLPESRHSLSHSRSNSVQQDNALRVTPMGLSNAF